MSNVSVLGIYHPHHFHCREPFVCGALACTRTLSFVTSIRPSTRSWQPSQNCFHSCSHLEIVSCSMCEKLVNSGSAQRGCAEVGVQCDAHKECTEGYAEGVGRGGTGGRGGAQRGGVQR